ncbi:hypothetical protein K1719_000392 [Acacia pycnantha]|nr:hypothetical protein K1719_000392 [Acacia pycnantha]
MVARRAKTSSSTHNDWAFDVYLHFITGKDTHSLYNFTRHLYDALNEKGIRTFIQYDTESGFRDEIHPGLLQTIKDSRMAIIVFSKEFASSTLCLDVLVQIYQCIHGNGRRVWPIFYDVDPFEVKHQREEYGQALVTHEQKSRADEEKIKTWKRTLREVANLKGSSSCVKRSEVEVITKIVNDIFMIINQRDPLNVAKSLVIRMARRYSKKVVKVWRLLGFGSSITGFICFALGPSSHKLFGRWNLLKIVVYCILSSMLSLFILFANRFRQRSPRSFLLKALVGFLVLLFTSLYSYYDDLAATTRIRGRHVQVLPRMSGARGREKEPSGRFELAVIGAPLKLSVLSDSLLFLFSLCSIIRCMLPCSARQSLNLVNPMALR